MQINCGIADLQNWLIWRIADLIGYPDRMSPRHHIGFYEVELYSIKDTTHPLILSLKKEGELCKLGFAVLMGFQIYLEV